MTTEKIERNKWIDAVGKLISLTQERKLVWRVTYGQATGWDSPPTLYEATYGSKTLRLSGQQLYLVEPESDAAWEFPETEATAHLLEAVQYQIVGVGGFLDELLAEAV
ncbi:MAG TPA: hypothetical protein DC047_17800 [Blastocatellia bacterium]|nr:hypothetical protein [Blastocatellia bacterium]